MRYVYKGIGSSILISKNLLIKTMLGMSALTSRTVIEFPWAETNCNPGCADSLHASLEDLQGKACSIFDRATILICPIVDSFMQKLIDEIATSTMQLDAIETCKMNGIGGSPSI